MPNLRFKRFTDDWLQRKFEDYYKMCSGYAFKYQDYQESGVKLVNGESIRHGYIDDSNMNFLPESFREEYQPFLLKEGDIVVGLNRPVTNGSLKIARLTGEYANALLYQRAGKIEYKTRVDKNFSFVLLSNEILKYTLKGAIGSDQPFISTSKLNKWPITIPKSFEEQEKIGAYFTNIDNMITLHQRKCDELQKVKKYMLQKMFPKKGEKVPEIRFAGFTDDWEQRKFHEVFDGLPNNTLSRADLNYEKGEAQNIHYGDILVKFGDYVDATTEELPYISDKKLVDKFSNSFLQDGDIIIADTAEDETVGKCTEIVGAQGKNLISGLHTIPCRPRQRYAPKFLGYYMNSNSYHAQLRPLMQGVKVISISKGVLQDTKMVLPQSVGEQEKIGAYFSNLDNLITLHQRKHETLKEIKKYMLQNMFPKK